MVDFSASAIDSDKDGEYKKIQALLTQDLHVLQDKIAEVL